MQGSFTCDKRDCGERLQMRQRPPGGVTDPKSRREPCASAPSRRRRRHLEHGAKRRALERSKVLDRPQNIGSVAKAATPEVHRAYSVSNAPRRAWRTVSEAKARSSVS